MDNIISNIDFKLELVNCIKFIKPSEWEYVYTESDIKGRTYYIDEDWWKYRVKRTDEEYKEEEKKNFISFLETSIIYLKETKEYINNIKKDMYE